MVKEKKQLPNSRIELVITGTAAEFQHQFSHALEDAQKKAKITGFRPGKAPAAKVLAHVGRQSLEADTLDQLVSHLYYEAVQSEKVVPVGMPTVEISSYQAPGSDQNDDTQVLAFTASFDVLPDIKIDGYDKIKLKKSKPEPITDEDVTKVTDYLRRQRSILKEVASDTKITNGMWANIGFNGSVDGVERADMQSEHHPLIVGEGQLIPGFEEEMIGLKVGESKKFDITFPKDYHAKELANKKAEFKVTIHELKEVVLPELDAEFAKQFGHETIDQLLDAMRESLVEERAVENKRKEEEDILDQLVEKFKFELPQTLVNQEMERIFVDAQKRLTQVPGQWERYLEQTGKTPDDLKEEGREQAERNVRTGLILGKIIQAEGIADSDQAGQQVLDRIREQANK